MSTEPVASFTAVPTNAPMVVPTSECQSGRDTISLNAIVVTKGSANGAKRAIAPAPSWNHIESATRKPGWVVSLGILAVLSTLLLGMWIERRTAESAREHSSETSVESPAGVPDIRSHLTGETSP